jgi:hypothetical protein
MKPSIQGCLSYPVSQPILTFEVLKLHWWALLIIAD